MTISDVEVTRGDPGTVVVQFVGEHDLTTSEKTNSLLEGLVAANQLVIADLSASTFIDSSFLHSLISADRDAQTRGTRLRLQLGADPAIQRTLQIAGLLQHLDCLPAYDESVQQASSLPAASR